MFEGFAHVWTPLTLASRLQKKPLPVQLAGEKLVLFRDAGGVARALLDRCPHRGVALSLGQRTEDGCLACPFHAWEFDGQGKARHVPLNPDARLERLSATSLPVRELGGLLWVYTAPGEEAPAEPVVPDALTNPALAHTYLEVEWRAHWTRAMENMLDSPHVPYVHATTIGRFVRPYLRRDTRMGIGWEEVPHGGRASSWLEGPQERQMAALDFFKPNMMVLNIPIPGKLFRMHALCVPVSERAVRMIVVGARSFATARLLNPLFNHSNLKVVRQDQAVVGGGGPPAGPEASEEVSVRTDRATLRFRKYYLETLKPSSAAPRQPRLAETEAA
jgi:phenylpropionate dioxygenase-like ring-hydroxylating dioxygenase large terminal subunit